MTTMTRQGEREERRLFFSKFMRHGVRVASVSPSSAVMAREMCRMVEPRKRQVIVELGAGTGPVTEVACAGMHPASRLIAVEIDAELAAVTRRRCPRAEVVCCDVTELRGKLMEMGVERVDVMLSGLPTPSLPRATNRAVMECVAAVGPAICFSQLTVMPWVYQGMYERLFESVEFRLVVKNLPPGGVYHCRGLRGDFAAHVPGKA